jgi:hypothetical protein
MNVQMSYVNCKKSVAHILMSQNSGQIAVGEGRVSSSPLLKSVEGTNRHGRQIGIGIGRASLTCFPFHLSSFRTSAASNSSPATILFGIPAILLT